MQSQTSFFPSHLSRTLALLVIFAFAIGIRLFDLTDLPLDFHPTRQLHSAIKARGMYYETRADLPAEERDFAVRQWQSRAEIEPAVVERIAAFTYQFTGEQLWVPRVYSSLFWLIGGVFLFLLARKFSSFEGALAATAFYLLLPYAVIASRSFQPDPLMTMLIIAFWWAVMEWAASSSTLTPNSPPKLGEGRWSFAILAGILGGLAIFIKFPAAFFIAGGGLGALLSYKSMKEAVKNPQVIVMGVLGILPGAAYLIYGIYFAGFLGQRFSGRFAPALLTSPSYYIGWVNMLENVMGGAVVMLALLGLFLWNEKHRRFALGLWAGYAAFGFYFNHHISTHDYYSLPLIPIAALSLAPLADVLFSKLTQLADTKILRAGVYAVLLFGIFAVTWSTRNILNAVDYRPEAEMWREISQTVDGYSVAGLTQDYGARFNYFGWGNIITWQTYGDQLYRANLGRAQADFGERFANIAAKRDLFLVTDFLDLARQPMLEERLSEYPVFAEGDGYIIYLLQP